MRIDNFDLRVLLAAWECLRKNYDVIATDMAKRRDVADEEIRKIKVQIEDREPKEKPKIFGYYIQRGEIYLVMAIAEDGEVLAAADSFSLHKAIAHLGLFTGRLPSTDRAVQEKYQKKYPGGFQQICIGNLDTPFPFPDKKLRLAFRKALLAQQEKGGMIGTSIPNPS
jgi:hypothetical protein